MIKVSAVALLAAAVLVFADHSTASSYGDDYAEDAYYARSRFWYVTTTPPPPPPPFMHCQCLSITTCARTLNLPIELVAVHDSYATKRCGYYAPIDEVVVCCPTTPTPVDLRYRRDQERRRQRHYHAEYDEDDSNNNNEIVYRLAHERTTVSDQPWVWDSHPVTTERIFVNNEDGNRGDDLSRRFNHWDSFQHQHGHQHTHFTVPDDAIEDYHQNRQRQQGHSPDEWLFNFEDPDTLRNCPPSISSEFKLPEHLIDAASTVSASIPGQMVVAPPPAEAQIDATTLLPRRPSPAEALINGPNCGVSISTRIIGGEDAGPGQFPWMARLAYRNLTSQRLSYRCAGSLISDQYVLTAAHCVTNLIPQIELVLVRLGELDSSSADNLCTSGQADCMEAQDYGIESVVHHSMYDTPKYSHDIALIRLRRPSKDGPIALCLPFGAFAIADSAALNHNGIIAGWGATSADSATTSPSLKWLRLPLTNTTSCASAYSRFSANSQTPIIVSELSQLCVQGSPNVDVCQGDSGGPLMSEADSSPDQRYTLLGLVSFGPRTCGVSNFPGVYTRTAAYMDWILAHMEAAS